MIVHMYCIMYSYCILQQPSRYVFPVCRFSVQSSCEFLKYGHERCKRGIERAHQLNTTAANLSRSRPLRPRIILTFVGLVVDRLRVGVSEHTNCCIALPNPSQPMIKRMHQPFDDTSLNLLLLPCSQQPSLRCLLNQTKIPRRNVVGRKPSSAIRTCRGQSRHRSRA